MVGAAIVEDGRIVAQGYHAKAGEPHAEVQTLRALGRLPQKGARLYVTLEPCCTQGRTAPCTQAILASGIQDVVIGCLDPNPRHQGKGVDLLQQAGIRVTVGVAQRACEDLNLIYNHWIVHQRPLIAVKWAATLDGYVATRSGHSQWITGPQARAEGARWRRLFPAIVVGVGTLLADNPALTARGDSPGCDTLYCPRRFIIDTHLRCLQTSKEYTVLSDTYATCLVTTQDAEASRLPPGVELWRLPSDAQGRVCLKSFVQRCTQEGLVGLLFEGGPTLISALLAQVGWDYLFAYQAPCFLGDPQARPALSGQAPETLGAAFTLQDPHITIHGMDVLVRGQVFSGAF